MSGRPWVKCSGDLSIHLEEENAKARAFEVAFDIGSINPPALRE